MEPTSVAARDHPETADRVIHSRRRYLLLASAVLGCVALLGVEHLPHAFGPDQAIFLIGGRSIAAGGMPYRDFWDITPVGIFLFYAAAGRGFGFNEIGVHAFELLHMLVSA